MNRVQLVSLLIVLFGLCDLVCSISIDVPYFGMKLIVVGVPEDLPKNFDVALDEATENHLGRFLDNELKTATEVQLQSTWRKEQIDKNLSEGVDLSVVNARYTGRVEVGADPKIEIGPLFEQAFADEGGFWAFANLMYEDERLASIGKLQIGMNNKTVGEGNLVAHSGNDREKKDDDVDDSGGLSATGLALIIAVTIFITFVVICGVFTALRMYQEQELERRKQKSREASKLRRMARAEGFSSTGGDFPACPTGEISPRRKKRTLKTQMSVQKPSREARKEKRLLSIIERDEDSSGDENGSNEDSFVSCETKLSVDGKDHKTALPAHRSREIGSPEDRERWFGSNAKSTGPQHLPSHRNKSNAAISMQSPKFDSQSTSRFSNLIKSPTPTPKHLVKIPATINPLTGRSNDEKIPNSTSLGKEFKPNMQGNNSITIIAGDNPLWGSLVGSSASFSSVTRKEITQVKSGKPIWGDLMGSNTSMGQPVGVGSLISMARTQRESKLHVSHSSSTDNRSTQSTEEFHDDGKEQGMEEGLFHLSAGNFGSAAMLDTGIQYEDASMGKSCTYFDIGEDDLGNTSIRFNASIDLGSYDASNSHLEGGIGREQGSSSSGPGWRLT